MPNPIKEKSIDHMELYQLSKQIQKGYIRNKVKSYAVPLGYGC